MKILVENTQIAKQSATCLIIGIYEDGLTQAAAELDQATHHAISKLTQQGTFEGKLGQTLPLFSCQGFEQILLVGCGKRNPLAASQFAKAVSSSIKALISNCTSEAITYLTDLEVDARDIAWKVQQIALITHDVLYSFDQFKSKKTEIHLKKLIIQIEGGQNNVCEKALQQGLAIAEGVNFAKNLANLPSNVCTPLYLAHEAEKLAHTFSTIKTTVLDEIEMKKLGMGALLGVAKGSNEEAKLICMEYKGTSAHQAPVALVGKGITFDSGGLSLKPADSMIGMKYDMCGAATVFGTIKAAALLKLPIHLVGVIPATENMPGGNAYKPEDILVSMSGQTIEVLNTDAEGRLALCDALTYCARYNPEVVIDIATLTGAVVVALGTQTTGLLSNNATLAADLLKAGEQSNDRAWQLPLFDEYQEQINSPFADMANVGGRSAGTITAACFLSRFTKDYTWAHLDVAGTAAIMTNTPERKATGRPIPLLMQYLINRVEQRGTAT